MPRKFRVGTNMTASDSSRTFKSEHYLFSGTLTPFWRSFKLCQTMPPRLNVLFEDLNQFLAGIQIACLYTNVINVDITWITATDSTVAGSVCTSNAVTLILGAFSALIHSRSFILILYKLYNLTCKIIITNTPTFIYIGFIKNEILTTTNTTIFTAKCIWTIFTT